MSHKKKEQVTNIPITNSLNRDTTLNSVRDDKQLESILHEKKIKKYKKGEHKPVYPHGSSYISISNPSLRDVVVEEEEVDERSLRSQFTNEQMINIFEQYQNMAKVDNVDFLPETLSLMEGVFIHLTENDNQVVEDLYESIMMVDDTFPRRFFEYAHYNNPNFGFLTTVTTKARQHFIRHLKKIFEFHKMTVRALINNRTEAIRLMHLLGLSHYLMKLSIDDFHLLALAITKLILHLKLCNEENVIHVVGYMSTVTKYIKETIDDYYLGRQRLCTDAANKIVNESPSSINSSAQNSLDENLNLILKSGGTVNLWARKNYRAMKDWQLIQAEIRRNVSNRNPVQVESCLYVERQHTEVFTARATRKTSNKALGTDSDTDVDLEERCFLTWLKKGYKFKSSDF